MKVFKEEQRFTKLWLIILIAVSLVVPFAVLIQEYQKNKGMSLQELLTALTFITIGGSIIFLFKLTTRIDEKGIYYKFFPFHLKSKLISWDEISEAHVRTYDPIGEFGGWGLKGGALWNSKKGKAINVSGDIGIQLTFLNGKKLLIGTQKRTEAENVIKTYTLKIHQQKNNL